MYKINADRYVKVEAKVFNDYTKKFPQSKKMFERACNSMQGGVAGDGMSWRPFSLFLTHGKGSKTYDIDGHELIDCRGSYGGAILGHTYPEVIENIKREIDKGLQIHNIDLDVECAELITELCPCAERVRFRTTGTEVVMSAVAIGRTYSGKDKVIKFYGAYHGVSPDLIIGWGTHTTDILSGGNPKEFLANTVMLPGNDIDAVRRKLDEDKEIGTIITDCILGVGGVFPPKDDYLKELRKLTKERGVVLIFDEVLTGFRLALGGAQECFGVTPDVGIYAKAMSGCAPFAAVTGSAEIMSVMGGIGPTAGASIYGVGKKKVFQSGTMIDNTVGVAASIAQMKVLKRMNAKGEYEKLNKRAYRYARAIEKAFRDRGIGCYVNDIASYYKIHIVDETPTFDVVCGIDKRAIYLFTVALMTEGVLLCGPGSGSSFLSFAHTDEDVNKIVDAMGTVLDKFNFKEIFD